MAIKVRQGGAWQSITGIKVYANGAWRTLVAVKVYAGGAWRAVGNFTAPPAPPGPPPPSPPPPAGTVTVTIAPTSFEASQPHAVVTQALTATPSGGLAPYTYAWTVTAHSSATSCSPANLATTTATATPGASIATATMRCTVTDSLGTVGHADVSGTFENTSA